jgi:hypothetical protein
MSNVQVTLESYWVYGDQRWETLCIEMEAGRGTLTIPECEFPVRFLLTCSEKYPSGPNESPSPTLRTNPKLGVSRERRAEIRDAVVKEIYRKHEVEIEKGIWEKAEQREKHEADTAKQSAVMTGSEEQVIWDRHLRPLLLVNLKTLESRRA